MLTTQTSALDADATRLARLKPRPSPTNYNASWAMALIGADAGVIVAAAFASQALGHGRIADILSAGGAPPAIVFACVLWLMLFERIGMYRRSYSTNARDEVYASLAASTMAMLPSAVLIAILPDLTPFRHFLFIAALFAVGGVTVSRYFAHVLRARVFPPTSRRIAVAGTPDRVSAVPAELSLTKADFVVRLPIETFDDDVAAVVASGDVGKLRWLEAALERGCRELIVTEALPPEIVPALLRYMEPRGIKLAFAPMRIRPHACDFTVRRDGGLALMYPQSLAICTRGAESIRRLIDVALALPAVILLSPVLAAIALAIAIDNGFPIFYRQTRVGRLGKTFRIVKFRTMRTDAESKSGPIWAVTGEARTTNVGRFLRRTSLDELPQLFNVLRGDMSIVGPRPERPYYVEQFRKMFPRYDERHLVRPGITGWSHVNMRRNVDTSQIGERLAYDLFYLEHWSVFMDLLIMCKTGAEFLFHSAV